MSAKGKKVLNAPPLPLPESKESEEGEEGEEEEGFRRRKQRTFMSRDMRKSLLGKSSDNESFNLDEYQMKKLNMIVERVAVRKKQAKEWDPSLSSNEIRLLMMEELVIKENEGYRKKRAEAAEAAPGIKYAIVGDELKLRQLIHRRGNQTINNRDISNGRNPLHEAVASGHLHIVRMFLDEFKAKPNVLTLLGSTTSLHIACERGHRQIASLLLTYGAHINTQDFRGNTPLHCCNTIPLVKLLMRYPENLDPTIKNYAGDLASAHYWKITDDEEKITEIQTILSKVEDKARMEKARMNKMLQQAMYGKFRRGGIKAISLYCWHLMSCGVVH